MLHVHVRRREDAERKKNKTNKKKRKEKIMEKRMITEEQIQKEYAPTFANLPIGAEVILPHPFMFHEVDVECFDGCSFRVVSVCGHYNGREYNIPLSTFRDKGNKNVKPVAHSRASFAEIVDALNAAAHEHKVTIVKASNVWRTAPNGHKFCVSQMVLK